MRAARTGATALLILARAAFADPSQIREFERAPSPALGHDLMYALYLPPGYDEGEARYPTLYLLHGKDGNHLEWLHDGHLRETLDAMIGAGRVRPMIVVMPEGGGDSWYVDSRARGGQGDYATAISADLVAAIDRRYRTRPEPPFRAIGGVSMGGFGALHLAFAEPFRYRAAASFSGAFWSRIRANEPPPAPAEQIFNGAFGRPFDPRIFLAESPLAAIGRVAAGKNAPAVFLAAGDRDRYGLWRDAFAAFERMRAAGMDAALRITGGDHDWDTWSAELPDALLFIDARFER